jgi:nucleoid-associated protein YgaU
MAVYRDSRYTKTPAYVRNGSTLILSIRNRNYFDVSKATFYTVVQGDTIDGIAYKQYGNAHLWWAIMDANPQYQSEIEINPGDVIIIPSFDEVVRVSE